jgi:osmoprotectant transport system ATP-binding protein
MQAMEVMRERKVDSLLVTDKDETLLGIVTVANFKDQNLTNSIGSIMTKNPIHVNSKDSLVNILEIMNSRSIGYVPVVSEDNKLVGLITRSSLISVLSEQFLEMEVSVLG